MRAGRGAAHGAALFHVLNFPGSNKKIPGALVVIYVVATLTVKPETRAEFIAAATACIKETRKEPGNIAYDLHESVTDHSKMVFVEQWANMEALGPHRAAEHMKTFGRVAAKCMTTQPKIEYHTPEKVETR